MAVAQGERVTQLGSVFDSWNLTAELVEVSSAFSSDVELLGSVTVRHWDGVFTFDDLAVSHAGTTDTKNVYTCKLHVHTCTQASIHLIG